MLRGHCTQSPLRHKRKRRCRTRYNTFRGWNRFVRSLKNGSQSMSPMSDGSPEHLYRVFSPYEERRRQQLPQLLLKFDQSDPHPTKEFLSSTHDRDHTRIRCARYTFVDETADPYDGRRVRIHENRRPTWVRGPPMLIPYREGSSQMPLQSAHCAKEKSQYMYCSNNTCIDVRS